MIIEILAATLLVSLFSLVGVVLLLLGKKRVEQVVFVIVSFATGSLFAAAFFDLFPEAMEGLETDIVFAWALAGIVTLFVLERIVHWHHEHHDHLKHEKPVAYMVLLGDGIHNFFDGVAIAASFLTSFELGLTTTIAIVLHEIPQELSDLTLLLYAGFSREKALAANLLSALAALAGALSFLYLTEIVEGLEFYGLAFTAGIFLYIAGTDLLPELHKKEKKMETVVQLAAMLAGIILMWFVIKTLGV